MRDRPTGTYGCEDGRLSVPALSDRPGTPCLRSRRANQRQLRPVGLERGSRTAGAAKRTKGPWQATEADLLADLLPRMPRANRRPPSDFALLAYLVSSPELLVARVVKVAGLLKHNYNPVLLTFQEVLALEADAVTQLRARTAFPLVTVPIPDDGTRLIRRVSYLVNDWEASAPFGGALWWPEHWHYFRGL